MGMHGWLQPVLALRPFVAIEPEDGSDRSGKLMTTGALFRKQVWLQ